jgi:hypothetical protein
MAAAGAKFSQAGVAAIYCVHGTFCGDDVLGLFTELEAWAPSVARPLRRWSKRAIDAVIGETGNYTPAFAERMETALSASAPRRVPVRLFHWSSQNHHIARADGAVRLIDELANFAEQLPQQTQQNLVAPSPLRGGLGRGAEVVKSLATSNTPPLTPPPQGEGDKQNHSPRIILWAHSHGGNVFALLTNLLGADEAARQEFFHASRTFFRPWIATQPDLTVWERVEQLLADPQHPVRRLKLDVITYGTPIRYGWDAGGYHNLLHVIHHRPHPKHHAHRAPYPPWPHHVVAAEHGDYIQQVGVAGTNFPPLPIALRTFLADWRLGSLLQRNLRGWLRSRLKHGMRVHDEGTTLLVDYDDPHWLPWMHVLGHAPYTRSHWLPLHCELAAEHFYGESPTGV